MPDGTVRKILIVDDHEVVRDGIKSIFAQIPGDNVFGEAGTATEGLQLAIEQRWDLAILDISLGGRSGLDLLRDLRAARPSLPVLILTMHAEEQYARRAFKAGAAGYITKDSGRSELVSAVLKIMKGGDMSAQLLRRSSWSILGATATSRLMKVCRTANSK